MQKVREDSIFYFAYGMNTNDAQMEMRCPKAIYRGNYNLKNFKFRFRGVADIDRVKKSKVAGVIWEISPECEKALDGLEGFPTFYTKGYFKYSGHKIMYYIMTPENKNELKNPSNFYLTCLEEGYREHRLDNNQLEQSLMDIPCFKEENDYLYQDNEYISYYRHKQPKRYRWVNGRIRTY
tara:strand:- start:8256 stop:8795 length:540 start_codon:yes stop_codon:yes gene_type:complete